MDGPSRTDQPVPGSGAVLRETWLLLAAPDIGPLSSAPMGQLACHVSWMFYVDFSIFR